MGLRRSVGLVVEEERKKEREAWTSGPFISDRRHFNLRSTFSRSPPSPYPMATPRAPFRALSRTAQLLSHRPAWKCASCRSVARIPRRGVATESKAPPKPYYITTPIFYVNACEYTPYRQKCVLTNVSSTSRRSPVHYDPRRYPEKVEGPARRDERPTVDRNR